MAESDASSVSVEDKWRILVNLFEEGETELEQHNAINELISYAFDSGLSSSQLDWAIALLNRVTNDEEKYEDDLCVNILCLLIPGQSLTLSQIDNLLDWFEHSYQYDSIVSKYFTFWLLVCLKVKVISKEQLQNVHYSTLFRMLVNNPRNDGLGLVLRNLVKPYHVTEFDFTRLHDCYKCNPASRKYLVVLLQKYASMKPKIAEKLKVKKFVPSRSVNVTDKNVNASLEKILILHIINTSLDDTLDCHENNDENGNSFLKMAPTYGREGGTNVTSLSSLEDLISNFDSVVVPDNFVSLLESNCGQYYVAFASLDFTEQLEEQVEAILSGLLNNRLHSCVDYLSFLKSLAKTQAFCSQGMPSVSRFLSKYLIGWDGHKYKDAIFDLIPWLYFNSFEELDTFMKTLFNVFVSETLDNKIQVVEALGDFYVNLAICYQSRLKTTVPFIGSFPPWMSNNYFGLLESATKYIQQFIYTGFNSHGAELSFLIKALMLYYKIFLIEIKLNLNIITVMPELVVLLSQTSSCISVVNLLCKNLTLYLKNIEPDSIDFQLLNLINSYCKDTVSILLNGVENNKLEKLFLGNLFSEEDAFDFAQKFNGIENLMSVPKHFAFSAIVQQVAKKLKINIKQIKQKNYIDFLDLIAPDCASLIGETARIMETTLS